MHDCDIHCIDVDTNYSDKKNTLNNFHAWISMVNSERVYN